MGSSSSSDNSQADIYRSSNILATKLFDFLENNSVYSPLSIAYIMSLIHMGSVGNTEVQITSLMSLKNSLDDLMVCSKTFNSDIVQLANLILVNKNMTLRDEYLQMVGQLALVSNEDFSNSNAICHRANQFIKDNTNNLITDILNTDMVNSNTVMVLINTIYFKTLWAMPFEKNYTRTEKFNKTAEIQMMTNTKHYSYYEDKFAQIVNLPYLGNEFCMGIILPRENIDVNKCGNHLVANIAYTTQYVEVHLPKFTHRKNIDLIPFMQKMGVTDIFSPLKSQLDKMTIIGGTYVSTMIHEAVVIVDEAGTEAAAVTVCVTESCSRRKPKSTVFYANRSFIYYIKHIPTNTLLFVGDFHGNDFH